MTSRFSAVAAALCLTVMITSCGAPEADKAPAAKVEAAVPVPAPAALPAVDEANAAQFVRDGASVQTIDFARTGSSTVEGKVEGDRAPVYAVPAAAGQTLTVTFEPSNTNLYANVSDAADHSGAALHRGEVDGAKATLKAERDMTFIITPFQPRAMARRGETGDFRLTVTRD